LLLKLLVGCVPHLFEQRATYGHTMDVRGGENPLQTTTFDVILLLTKNEPTLLVPKTACVQLVCQILVKPKRVRLMEGFHLILYTAFLYGKNCWNIPEIILIHLTMNKPQSTCKQFFQLARLSRPPAAFLLNWAIIRGASGLTFCTQPCQSYMQSFIKIGVLVLEKCEHEAMTSCNFNKDWFFFVFLHTNPIPYFCSNFNIDKTPKYVKHYNTNNPSCHAISLTINSINFWNPFQTWLQVYNIKFMHFIFLRTWD